MSLSDSNMSLPGFEPGTPAFLSKMLRKNISNETFSYKSSALTRLSYRLILYYLNINNLFKSC